MVRFSWIAALVLSFLLVPGLPKADASQPPQIYSIRVENGALVVGAHLTAGFRHAVLEMKSGQPDGGWQSFVAGPLDGSEENVLFRVPLPESFRILRVRAGVEQNVPPALHSGSDFFSASAGGTPDLDFESPLTPEEKIGHVLNRLAYGPTLADVRLVEALGLEAYLEQQFQPELIDEAANTRLTSKTSALFQLFQPSQETKFINAGERWRYWKGTQAPSADWANPSLDDSTWLTGATRIGYGDKDDVTKLSDMQKLSPTPSSPGQPGYLTVYLRTKFLVHDVGGIHKFILRMDYDDGFVAYLNGVELARSNVAGASPAFTQTAIKAHPSGTPEEFDLSSRTNLLQPGLNLLAVELHNDALTSPHASVVPELLDRKPLDTPPLSRIKGITQLQQLVHLRGVYSTRQLAAVLGEFWQNHFTTDYNKVTAYFEGLKNSDGRTAMPAGQAMAEAAQAKYNEYEFFYDHALGNFGDLLLYSATSPAQIIYLDNVLNVKKTPNENYAREILELFTFGVDNRYTQTDIEQLAKCFTGWTIRKVWPAQQQPFPASARTPPTDESVPDPIEKGNPNGVWTFRFNPGQHDISAKILFKDTPYQIHIPAGRTGLAGVKDAQEVIDAMVRHPSTAEFICAKLINKFVSDEISLAAYRDGTAPEGLHRLLDAAIAAWHSTQPEGNIATVLRAILDPQQQGNYFWSEHAFLSKIKTPVEYINSCVRALDADISGTTLPGYNAKMGMQLFTRMEPNGWSEIGLNWMDTSTLLQRTKFVQTLAQNVDSSLRWDVRKLLSTYHLSTPQQIVDFFNQKLFQGRISAANQKLLVQFVTTDDAGNPLPLNPSQTDYVPRLNELVGLILSMPQWQYQ